MQGELGNRRSGRSRSWGGGGGLGLFSSVAVPGVVHQLGFLILLSWELPDSRLVLQLVDRPF